MGLISQRPSELSTTAISQCSNFLVFKMLHPTDVEYIKQMVPNIMDVLDKIYDKAKQIREEAEKEREAEAAKAQQESEANDKK